MERSKGNGRNDMFDLDDAIREWRRSFRKNEALEEGYIEELESHLRDKVEHLKSRGLTEEKAFAEAVGKIGERDRIGEEYFKTNTRKRSGRPPWKKGRFSAALLPNYFKTASRKIKRQKLFSFINIAGLSVGLACCAVIILYVTNELSYDGFHPGVDRTYRLATHRISQIGEHWFAVTPGPAAPIIKRDFPQVEEAARIVPPRENADNVLVVHGEKRFFENRVWFVDDAAFRIFRIPFLQGSPERALENSNSVVMTEEMARKYFGDEPAFGRTLQIEIDYDTGTTELEDYQVTGIIRNAPINTHFKYDLLLSIPTLMRHLPDYDENFMDPHGNFTYVKLAASADPGEFEKLIQEIAGEAARVYEQETGRRLQLMEFFLQPVTSIHMKSHILREIDPPGNWYYIYIYSMVAFLILLIGCLNFINLSAALSATRTREVGLRKVIGARRGQLVWQFLGESSLITLLAFLLSLVLMTALLGPFNRMTGTELTIAGLTSPIVFIPTMMLLALVALGSGAYPAFILTAFRPAAVLQGKLEPTSRGTSVQRVLVVGQFAISIFLVVCTLTVFKQLNFMRGQALGFDMEQKLVLRVKSNLNHLRRDYEAIKQDFLKHPDVLGATVSSSVPGDIDDGGYYMTTSDANFQGAPRLLVNTVDFDFIPVYGIKVIAGRPFQKENRSDVNEAFMINLAGLKELGLATPEEAIGKRYQAHYHRLWKTIVGVVEDFHYRGMREAVEPLLLDIEPSLMNTITLSIKPAHLASLMRHINTTWELHFPGVPLVTTFLDENFDRVYHYEAQMGRLLGVTTTLGLVIACLGLFGLAYFVANFRKKEIGIRRVLGASTANVVAMLSKRFAVLVLISVVVAAPLAWYAMTRWLQDFAYRVDLGWFVFAAAALGALAIAMGTVSLQGLRAAHGNPANSLRNE
jgi:putative ABC transport system permease protein